MFVAGMWFQDLWTYDFRRTEMCIIPYATQMGEISFCAYNTGVGWRQIVENMYQNANRRRLVQRARQAPRLRQRAQDGAAAVQFGTGDAAHPEGRPAGGVGAEARPGNAGTGVDPLADRYRPFIQHIGPRSVCKGPLASLHVPFMSEVRHET